jgi:hypothetical protein
MKEKFTFLQSNKEIIFKYKINRIFECLNNSIVEKILEILANHHGKLSILFIKIFNEIIYLKILSEIISNKILS